MLKDLRKNLEKTNRILDDVEHISARAVTEQQYLDDVLRGLRSMVGSVSSATGSVSTMTNRLVGPASMGMAMFQAVTSMMHKQRHRDEERQRNGRSD